MCLHSHHSYLLNDRYFPIFFHSTQLNSTNHSGMLHYIRIFVRVCCDRHHRWLPITHDIHVHTHHRIVHRCCSTGCGTLSPTHPSKSQFGGWHCTLSRCHPSFPFNSHRPLGHPGNGNAHHRRCRPNAMPSTSYNNHQMVATAHYIPHIHISTMLKRHTHTKNEIVRVVWTTNAHNHPHDCFLRTCVSIVNRLTLHSTLEPNNKWRYT